MWPVARKQIRFVNLQIHSLICKGKPMRDQKLFISRNDLYTAARHIYCFQKCLIHATMGNVCSKCVYGFHIYGIERGINEILIGIN